MAGTAQVQRDGPGIDGHNVTAGIGPLHSYQSLRVRKRQRTEEDAVEQQKNGEVGADTQSQGKHGSEGKAGGLTQLPHSIPDVLFEKANAHYAIPLPQL